MSGSTSGGAERDAAAGGHDLLLGRQPSAVEIKRAPREPGKLARVASRLWPPGARARTDVVGDVVEKRRSSLAVHALARLRSRDGGSAISAGLRRAGPTSVA